MNLQTDLAIDLTGWDIGSFDALDWVPWGTRDDARAKVLASGDGFILAYVEAEPGYRGDPHEHAYPEFLYVIEGTVRNQGVEMQQGDGYVAVPGSTHADFETTDGAKYLSIFKL
jgi:quercetin dioxygenase-like cupin family protein